MSIIENKTSGCEAMGEMKPDSLFAGTAVTAIVGGVLLKSGQGKLKRGSLLCKTDDGYAVYSGEDGTTPDCILTDNTDTGGDGSAEIFATVYQSGMFALQKITTAEGYEITDKDKAELRKLNIILINIMERV